MRLNWLQRFNLLIFDEIDSTNEEAKRLIRSGTSGFFVIWAKSQLEGKGRYGKEWQSLEGNLFVSILMQVKKPPLEAAQLSFIMGLSVFETITAIAKKQKVKLDLSLKWPNDILIGDAKVGGILLESMLKGSEQHITIGLGLNIESAPKDLERATTSLAEHGLKINAGHFLAMVLNSFDYYYHLWELVGFSKIRQSWLKKSYKLGQVITINNGVTRVSGIFKSIDSEGAIKVLLSSGQLYSLTTGEVFFGEHV